MITFQDTCEGTIMKTFTIDKSNADSLVDLIDEQIGDDSVIVLEVDTITATISSAIAELKRHFDKLILFKGNLPVDSEGVDRLFGAGFHGIVIPASEAVRPESDHAVDIFRRGFVIAELTGDESADVRTDLLRRGIVPLPIDTAMAQKSEFDFQYRLLSGDSKGLRLTDRFKLKFAIETINLRQKLMVTEIYESFESSSL